MTERKLDFWTELRFDITNSGIFEAYCDWIEPKVYYFDLKPTIIEGKIGFLTPDMEEFKFTLTIDKKLNDFNEIESVTMERWMIEKESTGFKGNTLEINLIKNNTTQQSI